MNVFIPGSTASVRLGPGGTDLPEISISPVTCIHKKIPTFNEVHNNHIIYYLYRKKLYDFFKLSRVFF